MNKSVTPWIYIFQTDCKTYQKIGRTRKDPSTRLTQVQGGCPIPLSIFFCVKTEIASEIEQDVIAEFRRDKTIGEWFSLSQEQLSDVVALIKQKAGING